MEEEDVYLRLTEKGEKALELTFKSYIEGWSKEKIIAEFDKLTEIK